MEMEAAMRDRSCRAESVAINRWVSHELERNDRCDFGFRLGDSETKSSAKVAVLAVPFFEDFFVKSCKF